MCYLKLSMLLHGCNQSAGVEKGEGSEGNSNPGQRKNLSENK